MQSLVKLAEASAQIGCKVGGIVTTTRHWHLLQRRQATSERQELTKLFRRRQIVAGHRLAASNTSRSAWLIDEGISQTVTQSNRRKKTYFEVKAIGGISMVAAEVESQ